MKRSSIEKCANAHHNLRYLKVTIVRPITNAVYRSTTQHVQSPYWSQVWLTYHAWGGCIEKFPDWPPGARTINGTALCHKVQLYHYFVSQSSEFCRHNPLCCFSTSVYCCKRIFRYRLNPETFGYTLVRKKSCPKSPPWTVVHLCGQKIYSQT
jgi:hypothetical protein